MQKRILFISTAIFSISMPASTFAESVSFGVYPPLIRVKANTNSHVSVPIAVINNSDSSLDLKVSLRAFQEGPDNNGTITYYKSTDLPQSESNFLNIVTLSDNGQSVKDINLYPKESKTLMLEFPTSKGPQEDYFSVLFSNQSTTTDTENTLLGFNSSVATNVLVSVGNQEDANGQITEFKAPHVVLSGPVAFSLQSTNTGRSYETINGSINIYDFFGNKAGQIPLKNALVLPGGTRILGSQNAQTGTILWKDKFMFGIYTAKATVTFDKTKTASSEVHFIAIPLFVLAIITVILFVILSIFLRILKKLNFKEA